MGTTTQSTAGDQVLVTAQSSVPTDTITGDTAMATLDNIPCSSTTSSFSGRQPVGPP